jgi:hypothetical protein
LPRFSQLIIKFPEKYGLYVFFEDIDIYEQNVRIL